MEDPDREFHHVFHGGRLFGLVGLRVVGCDPVGGRVERRTARERVRVADGGLSGVHRHGGVVAPFEVAVADAELRRAAEGGYVDAEVHTPAVHARCDREGGRLGCGRVAFE